MKINRKIGSVEEKLAVVLEMLKGEISVNEQIHQSLIYQTPKKILDQTQKLSQLFAPYLVKNFNLRT